MQRPLKLAQYLPALGIETHVLAPDDPKWVHRDPDLRVPTQAWVHRVPTMDEGAETGGGATGGRWTRAGVASGSGDCPPAARPRRERDLESHRDPRGDPHRPARSRCRHDDVPPGSIHFVGAAVKQATGARWLADLRDPLVDQQRRADTAQPGLDKRRTSSSPGSSPARRCDLMRVGRDRGGGARARPARNRPHDRERLRLRRLRGPRVPAPRFRSRTPEASGSETRVRSCRRSTTPASTRSPGSSATSAAPIESGQSLGLGDRLELIPLPPARVAPPPARLRGAAPLDPERGRRGRECCRERSSSTWLQAGRFSPSSRPTALRRSSSARPTRESWSRPTTWWAFAAHSRVHARFRSGGLDWARRRRCASLVPSGPRRADRGALARARGVEGRRYRPLIVVSPTGAPRRPGSSRLAGDVASRMAPGPFAQVCVRTVVVAASGLGRLDETLGLFDYRADRNAGLTYSTVSTETGDGRRTAASSRTPACGCQRMRGTGSFAVKVGQSRRDCRGGLSALLLLPRRDTDSSSAPWVFCYACDLTELDGFEVLSEGRDGIRFGRMRP